MGSVRAKLGFWPASAGDITTQPARHYDMRSDAEGYAPFGIEMCQVEIADARGIDDLTLDTAGFELVHKPSAVKNFYDNEQVMGVYYDECKALAKALTGASEAFTFDHLIREPGRQISGGGTDGKVMETNADAGGGYVSAVHMDYTENTTWDEYLNVHGIQPPDARRVIALNFWRPLKNPVLDQPLAVCDARTVAREDLFETVVFGYGAKNYSWHHIGIETYNVKQADRHAWYSYSAMQPEEVLVFKSYDSDGVIGNTCPHASFQVDAGPVPVRRSIELRVLCFVA